MAESLASKGNGDMTIASDSPAAQWCPEDNIFPSFNLRIKNKSGLGNQFLKYKCTYILNYEVYQMIIT